MDFVNCLDECEQLLSVSVSAKDLVLLPAAVVKQVPRSECSAEDIAGVLSTHCERIGGIQNKIDCLECELKSSLCTRRCQSGFSTSAPWIVLSVFR